MEIYLKVILLLSLCYNSNGHLERLTGLLTGAHHQIHNKVHEVAGAVLGGFNFNIGGHVHHNRPPVHQPPHNGQTETVIVIVEEDQGNQGQGQPQRPYTPPQQHYNRPPNNGYNPNQGYQNHRPNGYNGQRPYGQNNNQNNYGNGNQNTQYPYQHGQTGQGQNQNPYQNGPIGQHPNQGNQGNQNQNDYGNNNVNSGNGIPNQNGYGNPNNNANNKPDPNKVKNPEQNLPTPNYNANYKPTETNYGQHNDAHNAENAHKETSDKTTKKPKDDGPLFVPLNDYTYGGDKITVNAPKRETDSAGQVAEDDEDQFAIDVRVKDE